MKEKLAIKTIKIEEIKDTLKKTQLLSLTRKEGTLVPEDVIDEVVKEYENQEDDLEEEDKGEDEEDNFISELNEEDEDEEDEDDNNELGLEEVDPQVLKLQERIKFLRHRCIASLGNNIFEKAYALLRA